MSQGNLKICLQCSPTFISIQRKGEGFPLLGMHIDKSRTNSFYLVGKGHPFSTNEFQRQHAILHRDGTDLVSLQLVSITKIYIFRPVREVVLRVQDFVGTPKQEASIKEKPVTYAIENNVKYLVSIRISIENPDKSLACFAFEFIESRILILPNHPRFALAHMRHSELAVFGSIPPRPKA